MGSLVSTFETLISNGLCFPIFFPMFCTIYILGYFVVFRNWSPKHRPDASSCFISLFHGTPAVFLAAAAILNQPVRGFAFAEPNTQFQNLVLDFSISYFTVDLLHYLVLIPGDVLFIAHHLATLFVFVTCRYLVHHGAFSLLVLLVLAEVTSACQNLWTLAGLKKSELAIAADVYRFLSPTFYSVYTLMRGLLGPWFFFKMSAFYLSGNASSLIPTWVAVSWIIVVGAAISVSILWISNNWMELYRELKLGSAKKET